MFFDRAGVIFGTTGGMMEAALRTVLDLLNGNSSDNIEYEEVRGLDGIKIARIQIAALKLRAAVGHGLGNARKLMEAIEPRGSYEE